MAQSRPGPFGIKRDSTDADAATLLSPLPGTLSLAFADRTLLLKCAERGTGLAHGNGLGMPPAGFRATADLSAGSSGQGGNDNVVDVGIW